MKIGIFGGTFNPPHIGHVRAAQASARELKLDRLLVIPDFLPPHKDLAPGSPDGEERLRLCRIAFGGIKKCRVSDMELRRGGRSYTVDTLRRVRETYPQAKLYLLMGTDMLLCFEEWREFEEILSMATLAVFARGEGEERQIAAASENLRLRYGANVKTVKLEETEASSTEIRALLPQRAGRELLTEGTYAEIIRLRLYGAKPEYEWLRQKAYAMLDPKRVAHVKGCEEEI